MQRNGTNVTKDTLRAEELVYKQRLKVLEIFLFFTSSTEQKSAKGPSLVLLALQHFQNFNFYIRVPPFVFFLFSAHISYGERKIFKSNGFFYKICQELLFT